MDLDLLWEAIFSEDTIRVRHTWGGLSPEEQTSVRGLLERVVADAQRIPAQRTAARFALSTIGDNATRVGDFALDRVALPAGALDFARTIAQDTAKYLRTAFGQLQTSASLKDDGTLVTQSDIESDRRLSEAIITRYPSHGILSEERDKVFHGQEWCWVIDPIDGTTNFASGLPIWGVLIALLHRGQPVLGVADFPMTNQQFYATQSQGAWLNGDPVRPASIEDDAITGEPVLRKTHLFACCTRTLKHGVPNVPMKMRILGSTGYDLAMVGKGACVGSLNMTTHVWDVAALWPIIEEAGGCSTTNLARGLFPLIPEADYGDLTFSSISACSGSVLTVLQRHLGDRFTILT